MKSKRLTSIVVMMMSVIIMLGVFCLPASAATSLSKATVSYEVYQTYTGKAIKPTVTVKVGKKTLTKNKSYTVSYKNNKSVGKGYIIIKGKGSYTGTIKKGFYIEPKATSTLKATAYSTKIKLSWSKVTGAKGYQVYQYTGSSWKKLPTTSKTSCTVTGLDSVTTYKFRVRPYAKVGSKTIFGDFKTVSKSTTIGKPTSVEFSDITESSATLKWNKVQGATSYRITYTVYTNSEPGYSVTVTSSSESVKLTALGKNTIYKVKICALNESKKITGNYSDAFAFTTSPAAVKITKAELTDEAYVNLKWSTSSGASGYTVYQSKVDSNGNAIEFKEAGTVTTTSATIANLTPGTTYVFKVVAFSKTSSGIAYSSEALTDNILIPVPKISIKNTSVSDTSVTLTWNRPSNIDGYNIYKDDVLITTLDPKTTSYTFNGIEENKTYTFAVSAFYKDSAGTTHEGEKTLIPVTTAAEPSGGAVESVSFTSKPSSMKPGDTYTLGVSVLPADAEDKSLIFESGNTGIATVSDSGVITAKADGTTTITVKSKSSPDKKASFTLTVRTEDVLATSISLPSEIVMYEGELISLNPTFTPANVTNKSYTVTGKDHSYEYKGGLFGGTKTDTCEFDSYISISTNNLLKAKKATIEPQTDEEFSFTVTVKTADGSNKTATTRVKVLAKMIDVSYKGTDASPWYYGNSAKLTATLDDSISSKYSDSSIRFKSSDTSIATVTNDGTVTCKGAGDVTITAYTSDNKYSGSYTFYVRSSVSISKTFFSSCKAGETYQINASVLPSSSSDSIMFYSSDTSVATVTNTGKVTFLKSGKVMIAVSCSSDPYNYKQVWFTSDSFTAPSGSSSQVLSLMKTTANSIKTLKNLPGITRHDETVTSNFATTSKDLTSEDLQKIFSSELSPKTTYLSPVLSTSSDYTTLKGKFIDSIPVKGQSYIISTALSESDVKEAKIVDNGEYFYEMKLTLKEESMSSLPASASNTRHGKVFDILTSSYINTYLSKINNSGTMSINYSSFTQRYYDSTLTLTVNKATGYVEKAVFDMNVDVNVKDLELKYSIITSTMDVSFTCNNIVTVELSGYEN